MNLTLRTLPTIGLPTLFLRSLASITVSQSSRWRPVSRRTRAGGLDRWMSPTSWGPKNGNRWKMP
jgi:hypothetical protein